RVERAFGGQETGLTERLDQLEGVTGRLDDQRHHAILQCPAAHLADESVRRHLCNVAQASLLRKVLMRQPGNTPGWCTSDRWCILPALEAPCPGPAPPATRDGRMLDAHEWTDRCFARGGPCGDADADANTDSHSTGAQPGQHLRRRQAGPEQI